MNLHLVILHVIFLVISLLREYTVHAYVTHAHANTRVNTLLDDADDIQRQLENEAKDRIKYGKPKAIWIFHLPTPFPDFGLKTVTRPVRDMNLQYKRKYEVLDIYGPMDKRRSIDWAYIDQMEWPKKYPSCGGRSQSPVDLPDRGLVQASGARKLQFKNYNVLPYKMELQNDGKVVTLTGAWKSDSQPFIYGGAGHSRRYIFHSLTFHWPSEHTVAGLRYPMESQALHISAEYNTIEEAINASELDPQAFLGVVNIYKYRNFTQPGLEQLIQAAKSVEPSTAKSLDYYNPPFEEYACYQGSLTTPPCTESVLWLVRADALPVTRRHPAYWFDLRSPNRLPSVVIMGGHCLAVGTCLTLETLMGSSRVLLQDIVEAAESLLPSSKDATTFRNMQALNDRRTYFFKK